MTWGHYNTGFCHILSQGTAILNQDIAIRGIGHWNNGLRHFYIKTQET